MTLLYLQEMAESLAAYAAVRVYLHKHKPGDGDPDGILSFKDRDVVLIAIGDGGTPRTAATFAFRSAWRCVSIDPALKMDEHRPWRNVASLETIRAKVQDARVLVQNHEKVVVVLWHAHVSLRDALSCLRFGDLDASSDRKKLCTESFRRQVAVVSCACCNYEPLQRCLPDGSTPDVEYEDDAIPGLMRTVRVWKYKT